VGSPLNPTDDGSRVVPMPWSTISNRWLGQRCSNFDLRTLCRTDRVDQVPGGLRRVEIAFCVRTDSAETLSTSQRDDFRRISAGKSSLRKITWRHPTPAGADICREGGAALRYKTNLLPKRNFYASVFLAGDRTRLPGILGIAVFAAHSRAVLPDALTSAVKRRPM